MYSSGPGNTLIQSKKSTTTYVKLYCKPLKVLFFRLFLIQDFVVIWMVYSATHSQATIRTGCILSKLIFSRFIQVTLPSRQSRYTQHKFCQKENKLLMQRLILTFFETAAPYHC